MSKLKAHLFVCTSCTYKRPDGSESSPEEAVVLRRNLKNRVREALPKTEVQVSAVTCLGKCESGIAAVLYPKGEWFLELRGSDEDKMFSTVSDEYTQLK